MGKKGTSTTRGKTKVGSEKSIQNAGISVDEPRKGIAYSDDSADDFETQLAPMEIVVHNPSNIVATGQSKRARIVRHTKEVTDDTQIGREIQVIDIAAHDIHPPEQRDDKRKKKMNTRGKLSTYHHMETRSSPCTCVEAMQQLKNSAGKEAKIRTLNYIGFGALLELDLKKQPLSLASWLVDHFDPNKCSIEFPDGRSIEIKDEDVHKCFGIPLGSKAVVIGGQNDNKDLVKNWRSQYDKQYASLRPSHVMTALLNGCDAGLQFVQNFMVLFDTTLVNSQQSGGVSQKLVRSIDSVDAVKGLNWCSYVVTSLIKAKLKYGTERKGSFEGSLLFLVLLYLDRVVYQGQRQVPRGMPVFKGWTDGMISAREKNEMVTGGFGKGRIEPPMEVEWIDHTTVSKEHYYEDLLNSAIEVSRKMKDFVGKLNNIPIEMRHEPAILSCYELGKTVLGRGYPDATGLDSIASTQVENVISQGTQGLFNDPTLLKNMKMIDEALKERDELLAERNKWPTFDLGIPGCGVNIRDPVNVVVEEINRGYMDAPIAFESNDRPFVTKEAVEDAVADNIQIGESSAEQGKVIAIVVEGIAQDVLNSKVHMEDLNKGQVDDMGRSGYVVGGSDLTLVEDRTDVTHEESNEIAWLERGVVGNVENSPKNKGKKLMNENQLTIRTPRPKRGTKPSLQEISPYVCRFIDPEYKNNTEQSMIVNVVKGLKKRKILFNHSTGLAHSIIPFRLWVEDCVALLENEVPLQVVDVWALRLNYEELKRSRSSPFVYFVPPSVTTGAVTNRTNTTYEDRYDMFSMKFYDAAANGELMLDKPDMIMFPVLDKGGYYVICFNLKKGSADILDIAKAKEDDYEGNYKRVFDELKRMLSQILQEECPGSLLSTRTANIEVARVLSLDWKIGKSGVDSGLYAMRHMETYKGDVSWRCGFKGGTRKNVNSLRMKYLHCLLTSDLNGEKDKVLQHFKKGARYIDLAPPKADDSGMLSNWL